MSVNEDPTIILPKNLDGKNDCPRQLQEGKPIEPFTMSLRYAQLAWKQDQPCPECSKRHYSAMDMWRNHQATEQELDTYITAMENYLALRNVKPKKHQSYQLGAREFTFTYSPKWFDDATARMTMTVAVNKLIKYYKDEITQLRAVGEVGTNGLSHVHCFYKLRGGLKITDKNFKRAYPHWNPAKKLQKGFEGGHHDTVKNEADFLGYIDKDVDDAWLEIYYPDV